MSYDYRFYTVRMHAGRIRQKKKVYLNKHSWELKAIWHWLHSKDLHIHCCSWASEQYWSYYNYYYFIFCACKESKVQGMWNECLEASKSQFWVWVSHSSQKIKSYQYRHAKRSSDTTWSSLKATLHGKLKSVEHVIGIWVYLCDKTTGAFKIYTWNTSITEE